MYFKHVSSVDEFFCCRYWCLKEAYVKAIGIGVANSLDKVEFHHTGWANISVKSDGVTATDWRFWLFELGKGHWVSPLMSSHSISFSSIHIENKHFLGTRC